MIGSKKLLAIIPARGNSKRLPGKNLKNLLGRPLIAWSIDAALKSEYVDRIIVSTDDEEIAKISRRNGAETPFIRPKSLARDDSQSIDVVTHAIKMLKDSDDEYDYVVLLQPTSPFRNSTHIDEAVKTLIEKSASAIISTTKSDINPKWMNTIPESGDMTSFLDKKYQNIRSQDLPVYYQLNGAIYLSKVNNLIQENTFFLKKNIFTYIMDRKSSIDIDDQYDFIYANSIIELNESI
jgi:CMP-N-acetylneuraminic acid synthetase